jgi:hypothetical protein
MKNASISIIYGGLSGLACFNLIPKGSRVSDPSIMELARTFILCARHNPSPFTQFFERYKDQEGWDV